LVVVAGIGDQLQTGSGVALRPDIVATNCHVVESSFSIRILHGKQTHDAKLLVANRDRDICLLSVPGAALKPASVSNHTAARPGERVYAIGAPQGLTLTISEGLYSGLRQMRAGSLLQTSAPISKGSSGGGLFNAQAQLIGLTTFMLRDAQNLNFAIPAGEAVAMLSKAQEQAQKSSEGRAVAGALELRERQQDTNSNAASAGRPPGPNSAPAPERLSYLLWLGTTTERLRKQIPEDQTRTDFLQTVFYEAKRAGLEPALVLALIDVSSQFRKYAVGNEGARGYMQIHPDWGRRILGPDSTSVQLFHMQTNLRVGCITLRYFMDRHEGQLALALRDYFAESQPELPRSAHEELARKAEQRINSWISTNWQRPIEKRG
jgi:hypothetical protein